jgi:hypothetical protein
MLQDDYVPKPDDARERHTQFIRLWLRAIARKAVALSGGVP